MIVAYLLFGILAGAVSFFTALFLGASFWFALLLYTAVGAVGMVLLPVVVLAVTALNRQFAPKTVAEFDAVAPVAQPVPFGAYYQSATARRPDQTMTILAVDDEPFILELIPKIAAKAGYPDVTTVGSGMQAIEIIEKSGKVFDCLVFDINMPEMDGIDLCARVRRIPGYSKTPIIMLTAMRDRDYFDRAFKAGATDYAAKPFDVIDFGERLKKAEAMVMAFHKQADAARTGAANAPDAVGTHHLDLADSLPILGVKDLIDYPALQNYLTRFSDAAVGVSFVMAVAVDRIEAIHAETLPADFLHTLTRVAFAIDDVFKPAGYVMSYAGQGRFVIVSNGATLPLAMDKETEIQERLGQKRIGRDTGGDLALTVSVGNPVRPGSGRAERAKFAFESAIALADHRASGKQGTLGPRYVQLFHR